MSAIHHHHLGFHDFHASSYGANVAAAARALLAALLAVKPRAAAVVAVDTVQGDVAAQRSFLSSMADDFERHSPNLSAELRYMASRG